MKPTSWKDTAELIGIAAIVLSLIFVGVETRNGSKQTELNTRALEMSAYQQLVESISEMNKLGIQEPEVGEAARKLTQTPDKLTDRERGILESMMWLRFRHGDMAYFQFETKFSATQNEVEWSTLFSQTEIPEVTMGLYCAVVWYVSLNKLCHVIFRQSSLDHHIL